MQIVMTMRYLRLGPCWDSLVDVLLRLGLVSAARLVFAHPCVTVDQEFEQYCSENNMELTIACCVPFKDSYPSDSGRLLVPSFRLLRRPHIAQHHAVRSLS
jgi:hypothetical protein